MTEQKNIGLLDDSLCYLIGAIEASGNLGACWRRALIEASKNKNLKIKFLDPTNKLTGLQKDVGDDLRDITRLKSNHLFDELSKKMRKIVREDHRSVDLSDFVIFYLEPSVPTCGSWFEFEAALSQKKPYFIISPLGKKLVPSWLFGICDHNCFFESIDEVVKQLVWLNDGTIPMSDKWVLFRKQLKDI